MLAYLRGSNLNPQAADCKSNALTTKPQTRSVPRCEASTGCHIVAAAVRRLLELDGDARVIKRGLRRPVIIRSIEPHPQETARDLVDDQDTRNVRTSVRLHPSLRDRSHYPPPPSFLSAMRRCGRSVIENCDSTSGLHAIAPFFRLQLLLLRWSVNAVVWKYALTDNCPGPLPMHPTVRTAFHN